MSNTIDVMEAEEVVRKGVVPKGYRFHSCIAWAYDEESYDCHQPMECCLFRMYTKIYDRVYILNDS